MPAKHGIWLWISAGEAILCVEHLPTAEAASPPRRITVMQKCFGFTTSTAFHCYQFNIISLIRLFLYPKNTKNAFL